MDRTQHDLEKATVISEICGSISGKTSSRETRGDRDEGVKGGNPIREEDHPLNDDSLSLLSISIYLSISTSLCSTLSRFLSVYSAIFFTYVYQSVNHTQFLCIYVRTSLSLSKLCVTSPPFLSLALSLAPPSTLRPIILLSSLPPPPSSLHPLIHLSQFPLHPSPCLQGARAGERGEVLSSCHSPTDT